MRNAGLHVGRRAREVEQLVDGGVPRLRRERGDGCVGCAEAGAAKQMCDVRGKRHVVPPISLTPQPAETVIDAKAVGFLRNWGAIWLGIYGQSGAGNVDVDRFDATVMRNTCLVGHMRRRSAHVERAPIGAAEHARERDRDAFPSPRR